jgi:hypothetical protein
MRDMAREEWVKLYRKYLEERGPIIGDECPAIGEISSFFRRPPSRRQKYRLLRHIMYCDPCRNEFEWMNELHHRINRVGEDIIALDLDHASRRRFLDASACRRIPAKRKLVWAGLGAAAIVCGVLVLGPARRYPPERTAVYRNSGQLQIQNAFPTLRAVVPRNDLYFSWESPLHSEFYIVELFDPAMALLWRSPQSSENKIRLPDKVLRSLENGQNYFWCVSGMGNDNVVIESPMFSFQLAR